MTVGAYLEDVLAGLKYVFVPDLVLHLLDIVLLLLEQGIIEVVGGPRLVPLSCDLRRKLHI